jgi:hypothetical protein
MCSHADLLFFINEVVAVINRLSHANVKLIMQYTEKILLTSVFGILKHVVK